MIKHDQTDQEAPGIYNTVGSPFYQQDYDSVFKWDLKWDSEEYMNYYWGIQEAMSLLDTVTHYVWTRFKSKKKNLGSWVQETAEATVK